MGFTARSLPGASGLGRDVQPCRPVQPPNSSVSQNPSCLPNPLQFPNLSCPKPPIRSAAARRGSTRLCLSPVLGMLCTPGDGLTPKGGRGRTILRPPTRCLSLPSTRVNGQRQTGEGSSERLWGGPTSDSPKSCRWTGLRCPDRSGAAAAAIGSAQTLGRKRGSGTGNGGERVVNALVSARSGRGAAELPGITPGGHHPAETPPDITPGPPGAEGLLWARDGERLCVLPGSVRGRSTGASGCGTLGVSRALLCTTEP